MFRDREVQRFQHFDGELEVGGEGEYDYVVLQRLIERKGGSWQDAALMEKPFAKGYFVATDGGGTLARLITSTSEETAEAARQALESWSDGPVEWLAGDVSV